MLLVGWFISGFLFVWDFSLSGLEMTAASLTSNS